MSYPITSPVDVDSTVGTGAQINFKNGAQAAAIKAPNTLPTGYIMTLPTGLPATTSFMTLSPTGQIAATLSSIQEYYIISDVKPKNTQGGAITALTWTKRTFNTIITSGGTNVTLNAGTSEFTLQPGTYFLQFDCPGINIDRFVIRLRTAAAATGIAFSQNASSSVVAQSMASLSHILTVGTATTYIIEQLCTGTLGLFTGMGAAMASPLPEPNLETYSRGTIIKIG